ncbi:MAG: hypothetical protein M1820_008261 [Bogoriella megaspora]|nr:MAG: hypothetical protein M1820_008261 [Bogoriella megaspora]
MLIYQSTWKDVTGAGASWTFRLPVVIPEGHLVWSHIAAHNDYQVLRMFDTREVSPFAVCRHGESLLTNAVRLSAFKICVSLLHFGIDKFQLDQMGRSPALVAARRAINYPHADVCSRIRNLLLEDEDEDIVIQTPLHKAAAGISKRSLASCLETSHHNINEQDSFGYTPLMWAVTKKDIEATKQLIQWGADVTLGNNSGETALHLAVRFDSPVCARILLEAEASVHCRSKANFSSMMEAAFNTSSLEVFQLLKDYGADINEKRPNGASVLHYAAHCTQDTDIILKLISWGANIDARSSRGRTPLFSTVYRQMPRNAEVLINAGARCDLTDKCGDSFLHWVAIFASAYTMASLTDVSLQGLDSDARNIDGYTPWDCFDYDRDKFFVGEREPLEVERSAFAALLESVNRPPASRSENNGEEYVGENVQVSSELRSMNDHEDDSEDGPGDGTEDDWHSCSSGEEGEVDP